MINNRELYNLLVGTPDGDIDAGDVGTEPASRARLRNVALLEFRRELAGELPAVDGVPTDGDVPEEQAGMVLVLVGLEALADGIAAIERLAAAAEAID